MTKEMTNILIDHAAETSRIVIKAVCDVGKVVITRIGIFQTTKINIILVCFALIIKTLVKM